MIYKVIPNQQEELISMPETGMGYQIIQAKFKEEFAPKELIVLNAELIVENDQQKTDNLKTIFSNGFNDSVRAAEYREMEDIKMIGVITSLDAPQPGIAGFSSAKESSVIYPDGKLYYTRLSAYDDDRRIDKTNNCLLPGSFTTTKKDYEDCVNTKDDPVERYALPNSQKIAWSFHVLPLENDGYQLGIVKPEFGKRGGGEECFFEKGTSHGTFKKQTDYGIFYP
ncbi:MAG: hypothetical protein ABI267_07955 [Ginsengibacter sp.]